MSNVKFWGLAIGYFFGWYLGNLFTHLQSNKEIGLLLLYAVGFIFVYSVVNYKK